MKETSWLGMPAVHMKCIQKKLNTLAASHYWIFKVPILSYIRACSASQ